ncbi:MAG: NUDIX hydrolase [Chloroflexota bacterium]
MLKREKALSSRRIYQGRALGLRVDEVEMPSGRRATREVVEHPDAVVVVPLDGEGGVYLVRQYRQAVDKHLLELPAGGVEPGETPEACVVRELREEIGMRPGKIERVGGFYSAPGFCTEYLYLFLARDLRPDRLPAEDAEVIDVVHVALKEIPRLIASGEIEDSKTIAGLLLALSILHGTG